MVKLGVNIDHVATLREARKTHEPDPVRAAILCLEAGCDSIVCHLREDRRHINEEDVKRLRLAVKKRLNLEMSIAKEIVGIACKVRPDQATLVPERRREVTTEGGIDVARQEKHVKDIVGRLMDKGIRVSLFINPDRRQIDASLRTGAGIIELHTGEYANAKNSKEEALEFKRLGTACRYALDQGLEVNAGHGLCYENVSRIARIDGMHELNIGHSIISRAVFMGLENAVKDMISLIR
jgi:pyridoxine 5-phosphate synthase